MSIFKNIKTSYDDTFNIDAFGRLRVSELTTQFDGKQLHDELPLYYDTVEIGTGSASHSTANAESTLTTAASSDVVIKQTKQKFNYMTGKSAIGFLTFRNFDSETNITKRVGYYNGKAISPYTSNYDGFYLESTDSGINFCIAKNGTANSIAQSSWNGDKMDGTGASKINLDLENEDGNLLFWFQFEWLGVGAVEFGFVYNGAFYTSHKEDHISTDGVYMESPNHSLRYEIVQSGAGSGTFRMICSTFNTEGAINSIGKDGGIDDDGTHLNAQNTSNWYFALGVKLQTLKTDTIVDLLSTFLFANTNDDFLFRICLNPTYAGTVTYTDIDDYSISYGLGAQANTVSDFGHILKSGIGVKNLTTNFDFKSAIRLGQFIDGTLDEIVVMVKPLSNGLDIHRAINWRELS